MDYTIATRGVPIRTSERLDGCILLNRIAIRARRPMHSEDDWEPRYLGVKTDNELLSPHYMVFKFELEKPENDQKSYRLIKLPNEVQVLLVSDPKAVVSVASLLIGAGAMDDPRKMGGLAHITEHCFMGCVYAAPVSDGACPGTEGSLGPLAAFVEKNGGDTYAYTRNNSTVYSFSIVPTKFGIALSAFARAFASTPKIKDLRHDVLSVTSEFEGYKKDQYRMLVRLNEFISRPEARSYHHIDAGIDSLSEDFRNQHEGNFDASNAGLLESIRENVLEWWALNYPARAKTAILLGPESLEDLTGMAVESLSSVVHEPKAEEFKTSSGFVSPWTDDHNETIICVAYPSPTSYVELWWSIPWVGAPQNKIAADVARYVIADNSPGSLLATLWGRGWYTASAINIQEGDRQGGYSYMCIRITLTPEGKDNWRTVVHVALGFIALLGGHLLDQRVIDDAVQVSRNTTIYPDEDCTESIQRLSERLWQPNPRRFLLVSPYQHNAGSSSYTSKQFMSWFSQFIHPSKVRVILSGQAEWVDLGQLDQQDWSTLPGYGFKFFVAPLHNTSNHSRTADRAQEGLRLPQPNEFVPRRVGVLAGPDLVHISSDGYIHRPGYLMKFKKDDTFHDPRVFVLVVIDTPLLYDLNHQVGISLHAQAICTRIYSAVERAHYAGLWSKFAFTPEGFNVQMLGYPETLPRLLQLVLDNIFKFDAFTDAEFEKQTCYLRRHLLSSLSAPYGGIGWTTESTSRHEIRALLSARVFPPQQQIDCIDGLSSESMLHSAKAMANAVNVRVALYGNIDAKIVKEITQLTCNQIGSKLESEKWLSIPPGHNFVLELTMKHDALYPNKIYYCCQFGVDNRQSQNVLWLLARVLSTTLEQNLVRKNDLGYYITATTFSGGGFLWFAIEGETTRDPAYAERCIDLFISECLEYLEALSLDDFEEMMRIIDQTEGSGPSSFYDEQNKLSYLIMHLKESIIKNVVDPKGRIEDLILEEVVAAGHTAISPRSSSRRKISIRLCNGERLLSVPARRMISTEFLLHGATPTDTLTERLQSKEALSVEHAIELVRESSEGASHPSQEKIVRIIRMAAEKYPMDNPSTGTAREDIATLPAAPCVFVKSIQELRDCISRSEAGSRESFRFASTPRPCHYRSI